MPEKIASARNDLEKTQSELAGNYMNIALVEREKLARQELEKWLLVEKKIRAQRAKVTWLNLMMETIDTFMHL